MHNPTRTSFTLFCTLSILTLSLLGGCTEANHGWGKAFCDDEGCFRCDGEACDPVAVTKCTGQSECGADETCTNLGCVKGCVTSNDCFDGLDCIKDFCVPLGFPVVVPVTPPQTCKADDDCSDDTFCDDEGRCAAKCQSDDQCGPDQECLPCGKCQDKGDPTPATCGTAPKYCSDEISCGEGKQCLAQRCHFECQDNDCPVGQVCSGGVCLDDTEPSSPECSLDVHCSNGTCINGYCHGRCDMSNDCDGVGALCQMGVCRVDYNPASK